MIEILDFLGNGKDCIVYSWFKNNIKYAIKFFDDMANALYEFNINKKFSKLSLSFIIMYEIINIENINNINNHEDLKN